MVDTKAPLVSLEEMEFEEPIQPPNTLRRPIAVRPMVLMGTGPTNPSKRVTEALSKPVMGLYTEEFTQVSFYQLIESMHLRKVIFVLVNSFISIACHVHVFLNNSICSFFWASIFSGVESRQSYYENLEWNLNCRIIDKHIFDIVDTVFFFIPKFNLFRNQTRKKWKLMIFIYFKCNKLRAIVVNFNEEKCIATRIILVTFDLYRLLICLPISVCSHKNNQMHLPDAWWTVILCRFYTKPHNDHMVELLSIDKFVWQHLLIGYY